MPYVDSLFQQVIPFDDVDDLAPMKMNVLDSHLGHSLVQITAFIFNGVFGENTVESKLQTRNISYISESETGLYFRPGGRKFFKALLSRLDSEGWNKAAGISGFYLKRVSLQGEDLDCLDAYGADLEDANLSAANLFNTYLFGANLNNVDLTNVDTRDATFAFSDLEGADLTGANLYHANFAYADLQGACFEGTRDLDSARELETARNLNKVIGMPHEILEKLKDD